MAIPHTPMSDCVDWKQKQKYENSREQHSRENILFIAMINMGAHCGVKIHISPDAMHASNNHTDNSICQSTDCNIIQEEIDCVYISIWLICTLSRIYASFELKRLHFQYFWGLATGHCSSAIRITYNLLAIAWLLEHKCRFARTLCFVATLWDQYYYGRCDRILRFV